jgi:hypothetical protein
VYAGVSKPHQAPVDTNPNRGMTAWIGQRFRFSAQWNYQPISKTCL